MDLREHNIIQILKSTSNEELKFIKNFFQSPFYNNLSKIVELFEILRKFSPDFSSEKLNTNYLFKKLYPGSAYKHSTITNLISKMQKLLEEYLIVSNIQKNPFKKNEFLLQEYFGRNLKNLSYKNIFNLSMEEISKEDIDSDFFNTSFSYDTYRINYIMNYGFDSPKKAVEILSQSFLNVNVNFINFFIMELMSNYINSIILLSTSDTNNVKSKIDKVISDLNIKQLIKNIEPYNKYTYIINLYLKLLEAFSNQNNIEYYHAYRKELFKNKDKLNRNEIYFHYSKLISYCFLRRNKSDNFDYEKEIFDICEIVLNNEYYISFESKFLPINLYKIIINNSIALEKYDWLKNFIAEFSGKVNPRLEQDARNFGAANLNFALGEFNNCLTDLNKIRDNVFLLEIRAMKIMIFYSLSYYNEGLNDLKSFQKFIKINKTFTQQRRQILINFLTYMDKLFLYKLSNRKSEIGYYRKKLATEENCLYKDWLIKTYQKIK
ncbi:MAG: hypothetical protein JSS63_01375 [Bacteroidetes bacterium]|nr:hypothetical protein [Bacteroidota bacterium]